jgi:outer membrane protein W
MGRTRRRLLAAVPLFLCLAATTAHAQQEQLFQNSWFWGLHAGSTAIGTPGRSTTQAGTIGAEWMITRTDGGLYVSYDQASFSRMAGVADQSASNGVRPVELHDLRTVSIGGVAFPWHSGRFRPYAGLGYALSLIGSADIQADSLNTAVPSGLSQSVDDARSRSSIFALAGAQWQINRAAIFAQASFIPSSSQFLVTKPITSITAGIRYNFGTSIEGQ